jgi:hypothetical protein
MQINIYLGTIDALLCGEDAFVNVAKMTKVFFLVFIMKPIGSSKDS